MAKKIYVEDKEITAAQYLNNNNELYFSNAIKVPQRFSTLNKLIMRDLNSTTKSPSFYLYTKDQINTYLQNPYSNQQALRNAAIYIYGASPHFKRLIQYFAGLTDLSYIVSPHKVDTSSVDVEKVRNNYNKTMSLLSDMNIKEQFEKVVTVCLREDTFYGTLWVSNGNVTLQQLPSDYCDIAVIEGNVFNVSFNFSYFDTDTSLINLYPPEFKTKYNLYQKDRTGKKWQELDSPTSFAIKCNKDIPNYALPPFVGIFREIYDLEDYRQLKLTKTELENYAMLVMTLGVDDEGNWQIDLDKAKAFYRNLENVLPEEIGAVLSPMPIEKISFEKSHTGDTDTIADAEQNLFTSAGVSSLLFNNEKASSNALLLSIKVDQALTFSIVKSIESAINRFIQSYSYGKNFKVVFLDCSPFNRKELGDQYLKACQYGLPMISYYAASQGLSQSDIDGMNLLENDILGFIDRFSPLKSSATLSSSDNELGRPTKSLGEISDNGEISAEGQ